MFVDSQTKHWTILRGTAITDIPVQPFCSLPSPTVLHNKTLVGHVLTPTNLGGLQTPQVTDTLVLCYGDLQTNWSREARDGRKRGGQRKGKSTGGGGGITLISPSLAQSRVQSRVLWHAMITFHKHCFDQLHHRNVGKDLSDEWYLRAMRQGQTRRKECLLHFIFWFI